MEEGESQILSPAVLPVDAINPGFNYSSKNEEVAAINGLGRIRAVSKGISVITVEADGVKRTFVLTVKEKKEIKVMEMDLGDYPKTMKIGERKILSPSVFPQEASGKEVTYTSSDESVTTVSIFRSITALNVGETKIIASVDGITQSFDLKVEERNDVVEKIDIRKYDGVMEMGKSQKLNVILYPQDVNAEEGTIKYTSDNLKVATVETSGEISAKEEGEAIITIEAGEIQKEIKIRVVVGTKKIEVNKSYVVLKPQEEFQIKCNVLPKGAELKVTYKALDPSVTDVNNQGKIVAKKTGETTILVSNGYIQSVVTVIVNLGGVLTEPEKEIPSSNPITENLLLKTLMESNENTVALSKEMLPIVQSSILKYLYETGRILKI